MADNPKAAAKGRRAQRLQAALRENLKRRKAQARDRAERTKLDDGEEPARRREMTEKDRAG